MKHNFYEINWRDYIPCPIFKQNESYNEFYFKAWELVKAHVKCIDGMSQSPYMDEAFCDTQIWIWDTCFMALFCKYAQEVFPGKESFKNFYQVLYEGKDLPEVIPTEDEPFWTGAVAGVPKRIDVHLADNPPLFAWVEYENAVFHGEKEYIKNLLYNLGYLQKHYEWLENLKIKTLPKGIRFPTWWRTTEKGYKWEGGCSGMDNTPRGRKGETSKKERPRNPDMLWIDAICQQALSAKSIAELFTIVGDAKNARLWENKFLAKKKIVNDFYWDDEDGFYYDISYKDNRFYKVPTIASFWTMTACVATKKRAAKLVERLFDDEWFGGFVPLVSLGRKDGDFSSTGKYWRGSLWLPTAYAALKGLINYGYFKEAHVLASKILKHIFNTYNDFAPHTIWESYSPTEYRPATQTDDITCVRKDFCGWSALGPISLYIEFVLGFYEINAFKNTVKWAFPKNIRGQVGIKNLRFGNIVTDIIADKEKCKVLSNGDYKLEIDGIAYKVSKGENVFDLCFSR